MSRREIMENMRVQEPQIKTSPATVKAEPDQTGAQSAQSELVPISREPIPRVKVKVRAASRRIVKRIPRTQRTATPKAKRAPAGPAHIGIQAGRGLTTMPTHSAKDVTRPNSQPIGLKSVQGRASVTGLSNAAKRFIASPDCFPQTFP
jgi:hypothetical protein